MKEIEILVKVDETKQTMDRILKKYKFIGTKKTVDTYYYQVEGTGLKPKDAMPKEWFRIRDKQGKYLICYKKDVFEGNKWLYSDEYETEVTDLDAMKKIVEKLGFRELVKVYTIKNIYEDKDYEIVLEEVKGLGLFLEVESKKEGNVNIIRKNILKLIRSFDIKFKEMNEGKPEMLLRRR